MLSQTSVAIKTKDKLDRDLAGLLGLNKKPRPEKLHQQMNNYSWGWVPGGIVECETDSGKLIMRENYINVCNIWP